MSYEYYDGSVFECAELNQVDMIVNTVNCKGFMGAGLALEFKLRYPVMFEDYESKCSNKKIAVGQLDIYDASEVKILNFPTKDDWKKPSKMIWIEKGLQFFVENYSQYHIRSVAFPKLGTNNGGLLWSEIRSLMEQHLGSIPDLRIYICLDSSEPRGTEASMLTIANQLTNTELKNLGLRASVIENYKNESPFKRFFLISKVQGIGSKSYEKLHNYCYQNGLKNADGNDENNNEQLSFF
jgi:O-acetyl-ADP-ribose deacetylase (regulator of RNase III)